MEHVTPLSLLPSLLHHRDTDSELPHGPYRLCSDLFLAGCSLLHHSPPPSPCHVGDLCLSLLAFSRPRPTSSLASFPCLSRSQTPVPRVVRAQNLSGPGFCCFCMSPQLVLIRWETTSLSQCPGGLLCQPTFRQAAGVLLGPPPPQGQRVL